MSTTTDAAATAPTNIVVIGGGLAGAKTVEALRERGYTGTLTLVAAENRLPYERPSLSKTYLAGEGSFDDAVVLPRPWYAEHSVDLRLGVRATAVDSAARTVTLDDDTTLPYDRLVLATGSTPRMLPLRGVDAANVYSLRTVDDADAIRATFGDGQRLVLIGGGWIGLEVAAAARTAGSHVTVLERSELPLATVLGIEIAQVFADLHRSHGVDLRTNAHVDSIVTDSGRATGVRLEGGEVIDADAVIIGIGAIPNLELAESAGLALDNGVLVDASLRSSDSNIYAVGDIANEQHPVLHRRVRVEHWATALNQPATAADAIMGTEAAFSALPYFYTDQYDLGMEYSGYAPAGSYDRVVVRGDLATREFIAFWLHNNAVVAGMNVNVWDVNETIQDMIVRGDAVDPEKLANPAVELEQSWA
ncbi:NAD(P)/FAD-dependent oxidoreductase [Microbacterium sp. YY-01]|uniref:NAD(P)/FAD-dependent oxidoreductase n=1 Tax=Microbacterium sp. YY-01 TaxID=3421634 RepID=UPI003D186300